MPNRISAWSVYDVFDTADGEQIFLGVVSDTQWAIFCRAFKLDAMRADPRLANNNLRVEARPWLIPELGKFFRQFTKAELQERFEREGLPYAPIVKPEELFDDPHLVESGGLADLELESGETTPVPLIPMTMGNRRFPPRIPISRIGEHTDELLPRPTPATKTAAKPRTEV
jgi:crotonobetainyl-CoA:carnitine CoA-transferase CaiB-like acyl-CoA transferase